MFEYSTAHWFTFVTASLLLNLSPGPDMIFIVSQSTKGGVKSGFSAVFGIWSGTFVHIVFAALGLSAILMTSAAAFTTVKWIGGAYLIYLGIQSFRSQGTRLMASTETSSKSIWATFRHGVLVSVLNPKVAVFFLAFLPQFVEPEAEAVGAQLFLHGFLIIIVAAFVEIPLIFVSSGLISYLSRNAKVSQWMDRGLGALFVWLGIKLVSSNR